MNTLNKLFASCLLILGGMSMMYSKKPSDANKNITDSPASPSPAAHPHKKVQVAVLLDVSNSMDGLIGQAKAQLWNMVSVLGRSTCNDVVPTIEIALYEYGRPTNDVQSGYVKQINSFTSDLDEVSRNLFRLTTNGGSEYCGHVMYTSLTKLDWDSDPDNYKVIFIAGNEDFLQGDISYTRACSEAMKKGVTINTIYCGDRSQGIREHWNLGGECGTGSFTNINQNAEVIDVATPYDTILFQLNIQLNGTYIGYGQAGRAAMSKQEEVDKLNYSNNKAAAAQRVSVKGKKEVYNNSGWDLIDASRTDSSIVKKVDLSTLPDHLKSKSRVEIQEIVKVKSNERSAIQKEIATVSVKRDAYIAREKTRQVTKSNEPTLESEIEKIIRQQAKKYNLIIQ